MKTMNKRPPMNNKTNRRLTWALAIVSFIFCFVGIMAERDMLVFGTLAILVGMLIGLGIGHGIKRLTGWGED